MYIPLEKSYRSDINDSLCAVQTTTTYMIIVDFLRTQRTSTRSSQGKAGYSSPTTSKSQPSFLRTWVSMQIVDSIETACFGAPSPSLYELNSVCSVFVEVCPGVWYMQVLASDICRTLLQVASIVAHRVPSVSLVCSSSSLGMDHPHWTVLPIALLSESLRRELFLLVVSSFPVLCGRFFLLFRQLFFLESSKSSS